MENQKEIISKINDKYSSRGQNPDTYLEGLYHSKPITYWEYCQIETLLTLQNTRTNIPDEGIFIMYHQINELIFKMVLSEVKQIAERVGKIEVDFFVAHLGRISRYFDVLTSSYDIMTEGMEVSQYMDFRTTLTPASGFQSAQYRMVELCFTDIHNLIDLRFRHKIAQDAPLDEKFDNLYWQAAGKDYTTGKKSDTLRLFEEKYKHKLIGFTQEYTDRNILKCYEALSDEEKNNSQLIEALRHLDYTINIKWVMAHYNTASKYLESSGKTAEATGGSAWKKYMHPKYQKRIFFPELWTKDEIDNWGKDV
jgi:tryptophan 2,3-dioxygenase